MPLKSLVPFAVSLACMATTTLSSAQPAPPPADAGSSAEDLVPPQIKTRVEAAYPAGERRDATVGLELEIDEAGKVADARVTRPAGTAFDDAALAAVRA